MLTLGIDPAISGPAGLCLYDGDAFLDAAVITFSPKASLDARYDQLLALVAQWAARDGVQAVACEGAYVGLNAQTGLKLAHAGGAMRGLAYARGLAFVEVSTLDTGKVLATIYPAQLAGVLAAIRAPLRQHARCAAAIALHGAGLIARARAISRAA